MSREQLRDLIARVEAAQGPDADLDRMIDHYVPRGPQPAFHLALSLRDKWKVPAYTASLDAALTLYRERPDVIPTDPRKATAAALRARLAEMEGN